MVVGKATDIVLYKKRPKPWGENGGGKLKRLIDGKISKPLQD